MQCENCHREISDIAVFCPECGMKVNRQEPTGDILTPAVSEPAFVPASFDNPTPPLTSPAAVQTSLFPQPAAFSQPAPAPIIDESDFYHIDATEKLDFIAIRGISITLLILSAFTFLVSFSMTLTENTACAVMMLGSIATIPLAILSLVLSCKGNDDKDPARALRTFNACRIMVIIAIILTVLVIAGIYIVDSFYGTSAYFTE